MLEVLPQELQRSADPRGGNLQFIDTSQFGYCVQDGLQYPADLGAGIEADPLVPIDKDANVMVWRDDQVDDVVLPATPFFKGGPDQ